MKTTILCLKALVIQEEALMWKLTAVSRNGIEIMSQVILEAKITTYALINFITQFLS